MTSSLLDKLTALLPGPLKALRERFDSSPIQAVDTMNAFVQTRASYVSQTALYGYLKTRMGTQFVKMFEDEVFSRAIQTSAIKVFSSCLADLSVFAVATAMQSGQLTDPEAQALARDCYDQGLQNGLTADERRQVPGDASKAFDERLKDTHWANAADGEAAFSWSSRDLIRFAPVVEDFKKLDDEIVTNSIRFRWLDIRKQIRKRFDGEAICNDWRSRAHGSA